MRWLRKQTCSLKRVGACLVKRLKGKAMRKAYLKVSRVDSLKLNVAFAEKGI